MTDISGLHLQKEETAYEGISFTAILNIITKHQYATTSSEAKIALFFFFFLQFSIKLHTKDLSCKLGNSYITKRLQSLRNDYSQVTVNVRPLLIICT